MILSVWILAIWNSHGLLNEDFTGDFQMTQGCDVEGQS